MDTIKLESQTWNISGSSMLSNFGGTVEIASSTLSFGDGVSLVKTDMLLKNCETTLKNAALSTSVSSGSLTVGGGVLTVQGKGFSVGGGSNASAFSVKNDADVDLTTTVYVRSKSAINVDSGTLSAQEIAVESGAELDVSAGTLAAETLSVASGASVSVVDGVTLELGALKVLSDADSLAAGTRLDLNTIFGNGLESVLGAVGEKFPSSMLRASNISARIRPVTRSSRSFPSRRRSVCSRESPRSRSARSDAAARNEFFFHNSDRIRRSRDLFRGNAFFSRISAGTQKMF